MEPLKPLTLPTSKMAKYVGYSADFLNKNKGVIFFKGKHYNIPSGTKRTAWVVEEMEKWALGRVKISPTAQKVLDNII